MRADLFTALAIGIHNFPKGMVAFWTTPFLLEQLLASLMAFVTGIMVYISLDQFLPMAHRYGKGHTVILGVVFGRFIMGLGLLMF